MAVNIKVGNCCLLLLLWSVGSFVEVCLSEPKPLTGKIIPGIYIEERVPVLSYEKSVPIIFEFKLKAEMWNTNFLSAGKMRILQRLACRSDNKTLIPVTTSDWSFTCPVFYHMYNYLRQFKVNFTDVHPTSRTFSRAIPESQFFSNPNVVFDECESFPVRKWTGINARDLGFAEYKSSLENCNLIASYVEDNINDFTYEVNPIFETMRDNFISNYASNLSMLDTAGKIVNNLVSLQAIQLFDTYAEITRFREAVLSCQQQLIPLSFVGASRLDKAITTIRTQLLKSQYTLTLSSISKLYKMPIADCIYGNSMLLVRILLPVERKSVSFKILNIHYPQFLFKSQKSENNSLELCQVVPIENYLSSPSEYFMFDRSSSTLFPTDCRPHNTALCHVPDKASRPLINKCIYSILHSSYKGIRQFCSLKCDKDIGSTKELRDQILPLIKRVNPSRFIITLNRITSILIKCTGLPDEMIAPQEYGAVEITLACNCHIVYHSETYYPKSPCSNQLYIYHIIPDHMIDSNVSEIEKTQDFRQENVSRIVKLSLSEEKSIDDPSEELISAKDAKLQGSEQQQYPENNHFLIWSFVICQMCILSISVVYLYIKMHYLAKKCMYGRNSVSFTSVS